MSIRFNAEPASRLTIFLMTPFKLAASKIRVSGGFPVTGSRDLTSRSGIIFEAAYAPDTRSACLTCQGSQISSPRVARRVQPAANFSPAFEGRVFLLLRGGDRRESQSFPAQREQNKPGIGDVRTD